MPALNRITSNEQLDQALKASYDQPLFLFKHSTSCPISAGAHQQVMAYLQAKPNEKVTYGIIHVIEDRNVSNNVSEIIGLKHESPQAIFIQEGKVTWHASHRHITSASLNEVIV